MKRDFGSFRLILLLCLATLPWWVQAKPFEQVVHTFDLKSGEHLFDEHQTRVYENGELTQMHVVYRKADGDVIAIKELDYTKYPLMPDMTLIDWRTGHTEQVQLGDDGCMVQFRRNTDSATQSVELPKPSTGVVDAGFELFIKRHWQQLIAGETLTAEFLVPVRQAFVDFRVRLNNTLYDKGRVLREFRLEPKRLVIRLIAPKITIVIDETNQTLVRYEGVASLRDDAGDNYIVRQSFE